MQEQIKCQDRVTPKIAAVSRLPVTPHGRRGPQRKFPDPKIADGDGLWTNYFGCHCPPIDLFVFHYPIKCCYLVMMLLSTSRGSSDPPRSHHDTSSHTATGNAAAASSMANALFLATAVEKRGATEFLRLRLLCQCHPETVARYFPSACLSSDGRAAHPPLDPALPPPTTHTPLTRSSAF